MFRDELKYASSTVLPGLFLNQVTIRDGDVQHSSIELACLDDLGLQIFEFDRGHEDSNPVGVTSRVLPIALVEAVDVYDFE